jgi:Na+/melibiose symporter-like transporter
MGLPATWVSVGIGMALIVDAIVDPLIGQTSDMWKSKWGRRHPFMYLSAVPTAVAVWALLNPPHGWEHAHLFAWMMTWVITARVFISFFEIPSSSLLPELAPNYDDRTTILSYRYLMGVLAPVLMGVIALNVFLKPFTNADGHKMPGQLNPEGYPIYGLTLGIVIFIAIMISSLGTHKEIKHMRPPIKHASLGELFGAMGMTLSNRNFIALTMSGVVSGTGAGLVGGLQIYFSTYFWELSAQQISIITLSTIIAPFTATAFAPFLAKKLGKKRAVLWTFFSAVLIGVIPISLRLLGIMPANGHPIILPILIADQVLTVALGIMGFIIVSSMMADIVEQVQLKTGKRSEGLLFSADNLLKQIVSGVGAMGTGFILAFAQFPDKAVPGQVPEQVLITLALIYLPISAIANIIAISVISFYKITREEHEANLRTLDDRQSASGEAGLVERAGDVVAEAKPT